MLPTREEWEEIFRNAEGYIIDYLSTPSLWGNKYMLDGELLFYDDETSTHMTGRPGNHLIDHWHVKIELVGTLMNWEITNSKYVDGWSLEELLSEGTDDYEGDEYHAFWYKFSGKWHSKRSRKGIRPIIVKKFNQLGMDAVDYGMKRAFREWKG